MSCDNFQFRLPNPSRVILSGQPYIFLDTARSNEPVTIDQNTLKLVQAAIIHNNLHNLQTSSSSYLTLGSIQTCPKPAYSHWKVFKAALHALYEKGSLWKEMAKWITMTVMGMFSALETVFTIRHLNHRYQQISQGLTYIYRSTDLQRLSPIGKYDKSHFYLESLGIALALFISYAIPAVLFASQRRNKDSFLSVFKQLHQINQEPFAVIQQVSTVAVDTFEYLKGTEKLIFCLREFLSKDLVSNKPKKNRPVMAKEQQEQFLKEIGIFFSLPKEKILSCWMFNLMLDDPSEEVEKSSKMTRTLRASQAQEGGRRTIRTLNLPKGLESKDLKKTLALFRKLNFLDLMPSEDIQQQLAPALLNMQLKLIKKLTQDMHSETYNEIFGGRSFSIEKFLEAASQTNLT